MTRIRLIVVDQETRKGYGDGYSVGGVDGTLLYVKASVTAETYMKPFRHNYPLCHNGLAMVILKGWPDSRFRYWGVLVQGGKDWLH